MMLGSPDFRPATEDELGGEAKPFGGEAKPLFDGELGAEMEMLVDRGELGALVLGVFG
jgi:hypothetical protein